MVWFVLFCVLGIVATAGWAPVQHVDDWGRSIRSGAADAGWLHGPLRFVEIVFGAIGVGVMVIVLALSLANSLRRAAFFSLGVVVVAWAAHWLAALVFDRERPPWQATAHHLGSPSYPSGHVTVTAALAGVLMVLTKMLVRQRAMRRLDYTVIVAVALVVAADRVLLGRHYLTDVVGGALLATTVVLVGLVVYSPVPTSKSLHVRRVMPTYPGGTSLAVIINPSKVESVGQFQHLLVAMAREAGWDDPAWYFTTIEDPGTGMARAAKEGGADLVVVCGGDGTVREVCAELAGSGIPVGIIPAGTGNLLARNLSIPLYLRAAIDVALSGQDRAVDLVEVSGDGLVDTHFMVMAGMGFDAAMMDGVSADLKERVGWLAYVVSGAKAMMFPAVRLEISVDDGPFTRHRARTVVVGNVGLLQAGMPLLPNARIDDGLLDVVLLHPQRLVGWLPVAYRIMTKQDQSDEFVTRMRGRTVTIRASQDTPRELDGDTIGPGRELHMRCIPGRVLVRVPR